MRTCSMAIMVFMMTAGLLAVARFSDNGNGTVTDNGTGLLWQKCSSGQNAFDCSGATTTANWQGALQYCRNLPLAGRSWRLPSVNELKSIVDYSKSNPTINTAFFPNTLTSLYWSSSSNVGDASEAWSIIFSNGVVIGRDKPDSYYVRCVSDGP